MVLKEFKEEELKKLFKPHKNSTKADNGQVTIIGGSKLFHGAPILSIKTASRIVDMAFFSSPEPSIGPVAEKIKSQHNSFIWVPWEEVEEYIKKSDAVLIGPGLMRYRHEGGGEYDEAGEETKKITETLLKKFPEKQWVIDAGSVQVIKPEIIPQNAILTPNEKEFRLLFGAEVARRNLAGSPRHPVCDLAKKYNCILLFKNVETLVCSPKECAIIKGGNAGLTKGGTGDVLAGLTVALAAKNPAFLAACAASWIAKKAADELYKKVGFAYNADDLAAEIPRVLGEYWR